MLEVVRIFFSGIVVFMIVVIKKTDTVFVRVVLVNKVNGLWISDELIECSKDLSSCGFKTRGIILVPLKWLHSKFY